MLVISRKFPTRPDWPEGPWDHEPDKVQWTDPITNLVCLAVRHETMGHWCGYVGVPEDHPWYGLDYDDERLREVFVHGGLTFSGKCNPEDQEFGICHVPEEGQPDHVWWFGFDCAHLDDRSPMMDFEGTYKTIEFVHDECTSLARHLSKSDA